MVIFTLKVLKTVVYQQQDLIKRKTKKTGTKVTFKPDPEILRPQRPLTLMF